MSVQLPPPAATTPRRVQREVAAGLRVERETDTGPLVAFRRRLELYRSRGASFDDAWREALDVIRQHRDSELWLPVLEQTRTTWRRAFDLRPPVRREDACGRIAVEALAYRDRSERLVA